MGPSLWLSWKELVGRKSSFALNAALACLAVGLCVTLELAARSREQAAQSRMYTIAPAIKMYPRGVTHGRIMRSDSVEYLDQRIIAGIVNSYNGSVFAATGRLIVTRKINGKEVLVIGYEPSTAITALNSLKELAETEAVVGSALGRSLGIAPGGTMEIGGTDYRIKDILPSTGTFDDAGVLLALPVAQAMAGKTYAINEISLYVRTGVSASELAQKLRNDYPDLNVIESKIGDTAGGMETTLVRHRAMLFGMVGFITILLLCAGAALNVRERKIEIATLYALGASNAGVLAMLACRSLVVGLFGSAAGCLAGALLMLVRDYDSALGAATSGGAYGIAVAAAVIITVLATLPAAIVSANQDHATTLQEAQF